MQPVHASRRIAALGGPLQGFTRQELQELRAHAGTLMCEKLNGEKGASPLLQTAMQLLERLGDSLVHIEASSAHKPRLVALTELVESLQRYLQHLLVSWSRATARIDGFIMMLHILHEAAPVRQIIDTIVAS